MVILLKSLHGGENKHNREDFKWSNSTLLGMSWGAKPLYAWQIAVYIEIPTSCNSLKLLPLYPFITLKSLYWPFLTTHFWMFHISVLLKPNGRIPCKGIQVLTEVIFHPSMLAYSFTPPLICVCVRAQDHI